MSNTFTLDYSVSGVAQTTIDTSPTGSNTPTEFTVDRVIDLTVATNGTTTVAPGAQNQDLVFSLKNEGNDTQAYDLTFVNESGDGFSVTAPTLFYYVDDGNAMFDPGGVDGAAQTYNASTDLTPDVDADDILWVVVRGNVPFGLADALQDSVSLVADTLEPTTGDNPGDPVGPDTGGNTLTGDAENVLSDGTGTSNEAAGEGDHSATSAYIVASANITAVKAVSVYSEDGSDCATIPGPAKTGEQYSIPGACMEYVITVENTGGTDADAVVINDTLKPELTFVAATTSGFTNGSFASPALPTANADCSTVTCEINFQAATVDAQSGGSPTTATVTIRALVQ